MGRFLTMGMGESSMFQPADSVFSCLQVPRPQHDAPPTTQVHITPASTAGDHAPAPTVVRPMAAEQGNSSMAAAPSFHATSTASILVTPATVPSPHAATSVLVAPATSPTVVSPVYRHHPTVSELMAPSTASSSPVSLSSVAATSSILSAIAKARTVLSPALAHTIVHPTTVAPVQVTATKATTEEQPQCNGTGEKSTVGLPAEKAQSSTLESAHTQVSAAKAVELVPNLGASAMPELVQPSNTVTMYDTIQKRQTHVTTISPISLEPGTSSSASPSKPSVSSITSTIPPIATTTTVSLSSKVVEYLKATNAKVNAQTQVASQEGKLFTPKASPIKTSPSKASPSKASTSKRTPRKKSTASKSSTKTMSTAEEPISDSTAEKMLDVLRPSPATLTKNLPKNAENKFVCSMDGCTKTFKQAFIMYRHQRAKHNTEYVRPQAARTYRQENTVVIAALNAGIDADGGGSAELEGAVTASGEQWLKRTQEGIQRRKEIAKEVDPQVAEFQRVNEVDVLKHEKHRERVDADRQLADEKRLKHDEYVRLHEAALQRQEEEERRREIEKMRQAQLAEMVKEQQRKLEEERIQMLEKANAQKEREREQKRLDLIARLRHEKERQQAEQEKEEQRRIQREVERSIEIEEESRLRVEMSLKGVVESDSEDIVAKAARGLETFMGTGTDAVSVADDDEGIMW